jgi:acyl-CoA reductase-like NAD-dependent aldehyde dehydrogenase
MVAEAEAGGAAVLRPGRVRAEDAGAGGYFVSPALVVAPADDARIVRQEQFAPALPVIPYDDLDAAVAAANDTSFGLCASVWSNDEVLAADVASRLSAGTVFVNAHGISAIDMYAPMGGWKQSGFGLELGAEGMQAFARQRVRVQRPGPGAGAAEGAEG